MTEDFAAATRRHAAWLSAYLPLRAEGLAAKAAKMAEGRFAFLRGSFHRWRAQFAAVPKAVREAPPVLGAADVHLENFGTWRDAEGRLAWGLNDFDEATSLPFTADLVRLAASILLERAESKTRLALAGRDAMAAALEGYRAGLAAGQPFILEADHAALRRAAEAAYDPEKGWAKLRDKGRNAEAPPALRELLATSLPDGASVDGFRARDDKGLGSLGRPRWILLAHWAGGPLAREAKAAAPSAWRVEETGLDPIAEQARALALARRTPDPGFRLVKGAGGAWVLRRLSPEARKVPLEEIGPPKGQAELLRAMGAEIANVHAGTAADPAALAAFLAGLPGNWLAEAADAAAAAVEADRAAFLRDPGVVAELPAR